MEEMKNTDGQGQAGTDTDSFGARVREALGLAADAPEEKVIAVCQLMLEEHELVLKLVERVDGPGKDAVEVAGVADAVNPYEEG